jgi:hypothetical protein
MPQQEGVLQVLTDSLAGRHEAGRGALFSRTPMQDACEDRLENTDVASHKCMWATLARQTKTMNRFWGLAFVALS